MSCDERRDLLLLYVTDALDIDEREEVRAHLESGCPTCIGHLAEAQSVVGQLPLALESVTPPTSAKRRLIERIEADESARDGYEASNGYVGSPHYPANRTPPHRAGRFAARSAVALAACVSAVLTAAIVYASMASMIREQQRDIVAMQQTIQDLTRDMDRRLAEMEILQQQAELGQAFAAFVRSPSLQVVALRSPTNGEETWGRLFWDQKTNICTLYAPFLQPTDQGRQYRLGFRSDSDRAVFAATFDLDENGSSRFELNLPESEDPSRFAEVAVFYDSERGSDDSEGIGRPLLGGFLR